MNDPTLDYPFTQKARCPHCRYFGEVEFWTNPAERDAQGPCDNCGAPVRLRGAA